MSDILVIGGSGFVSGTLVRTALAAGHRVWTLTRGQRPGRAGATALVADRRDPDAFARAIGSAQTQWDLAVDCIGYEPEAARQDVEVLREKAAHLVFISTDFVFHPGHRTFPQPEESDHYLNQGYGGKKRLCELELLAADTGAMTWTVVRPCHIYGPGSLLGCLPKHGRDADLLDRLRAGETLQLVGGGHFLQQPILAADLAELILSTEGNPSAQGQIFGAAGPDIAESRTYYQIIADLLQVELKVEELPVDQYLAAHPQSASFLCHRIYDLARLQSSGLAAPATPLVQGLRQHVESLLAQ
ncbi:MAG: NAD-dependent epimerase/dehydratase family protein [Candidatus Latescibacteria bacterium]|nr:NAD-dependent epimerase/dehydratase family protein [Candidatus Latescibacterota bacterium]